MLLDGSLADPVLPGSELVALVEALLLVSAEPPTIDDLAGVAGVPASQMEAVVTSMMQDSDRGWIVQRHGNRLRLATAPRFAARINRYLGLEREGRLSPAALETLAIVAWQQPITRSEIEAIRGVDCAGVLATLHNRELIEPIGRVQAIGNPYQYATTAGFLNVFGLSSLADLPSPGQVNGEDAVELLRAAAVTSAPVESDDRVIEIT